MVLKSLRKTLLLSASLIAMNGYAQLSTNPDKFLGNISTRSNVDTDGKVFADYWNQITPENETKWQSVENTDGVFTWGGADNCSNYAKNHKFPFKFHCFLWGSQYPDWKDPSQNPDWTGWMVDLNDYNRFVQIKDWMDATKKHYPTLDLIDVVNEAVPGHQKFTYIWENPLGGTGETGYDWIVKAFDMAYERYPEAVLIYNDFNTFQWNTDQYIDLVTKIRDAGAPIDAYGCQSHDLTGCSAYTFKNSLNKIQNALKMPMYITEYDIANADDKAQLNDYKAQFPLMWEADYCAGVTLWGWIYGKTWTDGGNSGLIKTNGVERPALTWLREYMASDAAKNAKSPYPGMKKPISFYIRPHFYKAPINEPNEITITAKMHNGAQVEKVELYANSKLVATVTEPTDATKGTYTCYVTPTSVTAKVNLKAIAYTNDGKTYERLGGFYGNKWPRKPFYGEPLALPGVLEGENFDMGGEGISYHSSRTGVLDNNYREDKEKTSIFELADNSGYYITNSNAGDWYDYTFTTANSRVKFEAIVSTNDAEGAAYTMYVYNSNGDMVCQREVEVPFTERNKYTKVTGTSIGTRTLQVGETYRLRILFNKGHAKIDKIYLGLTEEEALGIQDVNIQEEGASYTVYSPSGVQVGEIDAQDNADAIRQIRNLTNAAGIYIIKDNASGKSKTVAVK